MTDTPSNTSIPVDELREELRRKFYYFNRASMMFLRTPPTTARGVTDAEAGLQRIVDETMAIIEAHTEEKVREALEKAHEYYLGRIRLRLNTRKENE